jgi:hypothetical protein
MMFGKPARYLRFNPQDKRAWDAAIAQADEEYLSKIHCMVCGSDCHSHVARYFTFQVSLLLVPADQVMLTHIVQGAGYS